jgi:hypothetical protein
LKFVLPKHEKLIKDGKKIFTFRRDLQNIFKLGQPVEFWKYKNYYSKENVYQFGTGYIVDINPIEINCEERKVYLGDICIKHRVPLDTTEIQIILEADGFPNESKFWEYYNQHKYIKQVVDDKFSLITNYNYKMINFRFNGVGK